MRLHRVQGHCIDLDHVCAVSSTYDFNAAQYQLDDTDHVLVTDYKTPGEDPSAFTVYFLRGGKPMTFASDSIEELGRANNELIVQWNCGGRKHLK